MESNLRDAIDYLVNLGDENAEPKVVEIDGKLYCNKSLKRYDETPKASPISGASLTALMDYITNNPAELPDRKMILHVTAPDEVRFYSSLDKERERETLFVATAKLPRFEFDHYMSQEEFIIGMQSCFAQNQDSELILKVSGNVENKSVAHYGDDGVSQKATIKQGIASRADVIVPNPVTLIPYRTFLEVKQIESKFVFRIGEDRNEQPIFKLVEADGGAWKYAAMRRVADYLADNLQDLIKSGMITVIA